MKAGKGDRKRKLVKYSAFLRSLRLSDGFRSREEYRRYREQGSHADPRVWRWNEEMDAIAGAAANRKRIPPDAEIERIALGREMVQKVAEQKHDLAALVEDFSK